jgi:hypothetical protein
LQPAIDALPATGGKIFVKAGIYPIAGTIKTKESNVQIQGEGMGTTVFVGNSAMTGNTPALEVFNAAAGTARQLVADTARGDTALKASPADIRRLCGHWRRTCNFRSLRRGLAKPSPSPGSNFRGFR